jgi:hypothetical protein
MIVSESECIEFLTVPLQFKFCIIKHELNIALDELLSRIDDSFLLHHIEKYEIHYNGFDY